MSFLLDPPTLVIIGGLLGISEEKFHLSKKTLKKFGCVIVAVFWVFSSALYLDMIMWYIPGLWNMEGSVWMFHSNITGILKAEVPLAVVVLMFLLYPAWLYTGFLAEKKIFNPCTLDLTGP